jgi:2-octaprenyl-6-methoxyphenol hydroxylase
MPDTKGARADHPAVAVIGGGPAGFTAAIALASAQVSTVLIDRRSTGADNRTTALLAGAVTALDILRVWPACAAQAAPLKLMRIVDDTGRLVRAPELKFDAGEIGLDAFGYNIENRHLLAALATRASALPALRIIEAQVVGITSGTNAVTIRLDGGEIVETGLVIGADGRHSLCRTAAAIKVDERVYPQSALTLSFGHSRPHRDSSTEFHTPAGPFTQVPLPGNRSSLVWVIEPNEVEAIAALDDGALSAKVECGLHSILGKVRVESGRGLFPLSIATARVFAADRIVLVGEAAHVIPPIGAQGLNLGLRDATTIAELVIDAVRDGGDPGAPALLSRYEESRRADIATRTLAVDLLNRSLLSDFLPVQGARGLGLYLIDRIGPLRRAVLREGATPATSQPRLMRGEAL